MQLEILVLAESALDADKDYVEAMLPDGVMLPDAAISEMILVYQELVGSVQWPQLSKYGVFDVTATGDDRVRAEHGGDPAFEGRASNLAAMACLLLSTEI